MTTLENLPNELLAAVADYSPPQAIYNLNLVNHRLHNLTLEPALLLHTVLSSPKYAPLVKHIQWAADPESSDGARLRSGIDADILLDMHQPGLISPARILELIHQAGVYDRDSLPMNRYWFLELVLWYLPNVTTIEAYGTSRWNDCVLVY